MPYEILLFAPAPDRRRAGGAGQGPRRPGARRDGPARGPPGRARHARRAPARRATARSSPTAATPSSSPKPRPTTASRSRAGRAALPARPRAARLRGRQPHAVRLLAPHLTFENHRSVLDSARGKARPEVEEIVARLAPRPDVAASLAEARRRRGRAPAVSAEPRPDAEPWPGRSRRGPGRCEPAPRGTGRDDPGQRPAAAPARGRGARAGSLPVPGDDRGRDPREAAARPRHAAPRDPSGDDAAILDRALTSLLLDLAKAKFAATDAPRPSRGTGPGSRHIPAEVRRVGLAAGPRVLRVRRGGGPSLQGARLRGVPPRPAVRGGRSRHRRQHPAAVPTAQRLRGAGVLRAARRRAGPGHARSRHAGRQRAEWAPSRRSPEPRRSTRGPGRSSRWPRSPGRSQNESRRSGVGRLR